MDADGDQHDEEMDSDSELEPDYRVKTEALDRFMPDAEGTPVDLTPPKPVGSTKQSIMSIIDRTPETEREALAALPDQGPSPDSAVPSKRKFEYEPPAEKENADPIERVE
jgi:hypothetical protein